MAAMDPNARYVPLEGLSMGIVVVSSICVLLSVLAVGLRTYARLRDRLFGFDDGLVLFGTVGKLSALLIPRANC